MHDKYSTTTRCNGYYRMDSNLRAAIHDEIDKAIEERKEEIISKIVARQANWGLWVQTTESEIDTSCLDKYRIHNVSHFRCSNCKAIALDEITTKYCPFCGAEMKNGGNF